MPTSSRTKTWPHDIPWLWRFCVRAAVAVMLPVVIPYCWVRGHREDAAAWWRVGKECWRTGDTKLSRKDFEGSDA